MPKASVFDGDNGLCGVERGGVLYEADFPYDVADAIAAMENSDDPPADWYETELRLGGMTAEQARQTLAGRVLSD